MHPHIHDVHVACIPLLVAAPCVAAGSKYNKGSRCVYTCRLSLTLVQKLSEVILFAILAIVHLISAMIWVAEKEIELHAIEGISMGKYSSSYQSV